MLIAMQDTPHIERALGDWMRRRLPFALAELVMFGLKQGWACLFGGLMLLALIASKAVWQEGWTLARYDALLIFSLCLQALMLALRLETWREARVILLFHVTGTAMEIFKVNAGSWAYPEAALMKLAGVPLFSGFMYAAVGSYIARVIRVFDMGFAPYPPFWMTIALAVAIYINFFAHHFLPDIRILLFLLTFLLFWRTRVWFRIGANRYWMPLPLAAFLVSLFLWLAENIGTITGTWIYAGQATHHVSFSKMGSWYLLLYVSFASVTLLYRDALDSVRRSPARPSTKAGALTPEAN
jgi:uncharacterized membrane protein YoaT (DUF817 family)